ncbi:TPA: recombinase family protein, partial [Clostridioides difficile]
KNLISNIVLELLSYLGEKERIKIKERQMQGIRALKDRNDGHGVGRPKISYPENFEEIYSNWKDKKITAKKAMEQLKLKKSTFYKLVNDFEKDKD